jgi:hypothetical protein
MHMQSKQVRLKANWRWQANRYWTPYTTSQQNGQKHYQTLLKHIYECFETDHHGMFHCVDFLCSLWHDQVLFATLHCDLMSR